MELGLQSVRVILLLMLALSLYEVYKGYRKGHVKYSLKKAVNMWKPLISMVGSIYVLLFGVFILNIVIESEAFVSASNDLVIRLASSVWVVILLVLFLKMVLSPNKPFIKYTETELEWRIDEIIKGRNKAPKWLKWAYGKNPTKDSNIL